MKWLIVGLVFGILAMSSTVQALDPWWDIDWQKRTPINISSRTGDLTNYTVVINVSTTLCDGSCQPDFDDVRFSNINMSIYDQTKLYGVENDWMRYAVRINDTIPGDGLIIYLYYNNSIAPVFSNYTNVYEEYDDFSTNNFSDNGGLIFVNTTSEVMELRTATSSNYWAYKNNTDLAVKWEDDWVMELTVEHIFHGAGGETASFGWFNNLTSDITDAANQERFVFNGWRNGRAIALINSSTNFEIAPEGGDFDVGEYMLFTLWKSNNMVYGNVSYLNGTTIYSNTTGVNVTGQYLPYFGGKNNIQATEVQNWVHNYTKRKTVFPEPLIIFDTQEAIIDFGLQPCGLLTNTTAAFFYIFDEENSTALNGSWEMSTQSSYQGEVVNQSFLFPSNQSVKLCIYPENATMSTNVSIKYGAGGYSDRWFYLYNTPFSNQTQNHTVYSYTEVLSSYVDFIVKSSTLQPEEDVVIKMLRYYPANDTYISVAMGKTGFDGKVTIPLKFYEFYRIVLERYGILLVSLTPKMISDYEQELFTTPSVNLVLYKYLSDSVSATCSYNNATTILTCTMSDSSGCLQESYLTVKQVTAFNNSETKCTDYSVGSTNVLTCNLTGHNNNTLLNYDLSGGFQCSQWINYSAYSNWLDFTSPLVPWGTLGILMAFAIIVTLGFIGVYSPTSSIMMAFVGVVVSFWLGILPIQFGSIIALTVSVGILLYKLRS